jgi:hypothetical protein
VRAHGLRDPREGCFPRAATTSCSRRATPLRRAGTTPILYAGTEVAEVSPSEELGRTLEVVTKNMEEMEASA